MSTNTHHCIGLIGRAIDTSICSALHDREASHLSVEGYAYKLIDFRMRGCPGQTVHDAVCSGYTGFKFTHPFNPTTISSVAEFSCGASFLDVVSTTAIRDGRSFAYYMAHNGFLSALNNVLPPACLEHMTPAGSGGSGSIVPFRLRASAAASLQICDVHDAQAPCERVARSIPATTTNSASPNEIETRLCPSNGVAGMPASGTAGNPGIPLAISALWASLWITNFVYRSMSSENNTAETVTATTVPTIRDCCMIGARAADIFALLTHITPDRDHTQFRLAELVAPQSVAA